MALRGAEYQHGVSKRVIDVSLALAALNVSAPFIWVGMNSERGRQAARRFLERTERTGRGDASTPFYKFKTPSRSATERVLGLARVADARRDRLLDCLRDTVHMGAFDEIPQLAGVLRGDLSFVGHMAVGAATDTRFAEANSALHSQWRDVCFGARPGFIGPSRMFAHQLHGQQHTAGEYDRIAERIMNLDIAYETEQASAAFDVGFAARTSLRMLGLARQALATEA